MTGVQTCALPICWTLIQELPSAITHMNMVLDGRTVWFAGGFKDGYRGHAIAEVWSYDVALDRYTAAPLLPEPRAGGGLAVVDGTLHYFGGLMADRDTDSNDHWVLDLEDWAAGSAAWTHAAPMPVPRNQFSSVVFDGKIYAIGGQAARVREPDLLADRGPSVQCDDRRRDRGRPTRRRGR